MSTSTPVKVKAKRRKNRRKALQRQTTAHRQIQEIEMEMLDNQQTTFNQCFDNNHSKLQFRLFLSIKIRSKQINYISRPVIFIQMFCEFI